MGAQLTDREVGASRRGMSRRGWLAVAIAGAIVVGTAGAITPVVIANADMSSAREEFAAAADELDEARAGFDAAAALFAERVEAATAEHELLRNVEATLPVELVDPVADRDAFVHAAAFFAETAGVGPDEAGTDANQPADQSFTVASTPEAEDTAVELREQTASMLSAAQDAVSATADVQAAIEAIDDSHDSALSSLVTLQAPANRKGLTIAFEKAGAVEIAAFGAAVAALVPTEAVGAQPQTLEARVGLFAGYATAYTAAKTSHEATVAAEQKAAEAAEEARRAAEQTPDSSSGGVRSGTGEYVPSPERIAAIKRGEIVRTSFPCSAEHTTSTAFWGAPNWAPADATSVWVEFENPGVSWGIRWTCPEY